MVEKIHLENMTDGVKGFLLRLTEKPQTSRKPDPQQSPRTPDVPVYVPTVGHGSDPMAMNIKIHTAYSSQEILRLLEETEVIQLLQVRKDLDIIKQRTH